MSELNWGLCGPATVPNLRRTRTLDLGAAVRAFNDLAVPGLGNVWFAKQIFLATLGVAVAEGARNQGAAVQNIRVTNAIEALACWLTYRRNKWTADARLRGRTKLNGKSDIAYATVQAPNFYVTQPMRMATGQALLALGLVESTTERFTKFSCTAKGHEFIALACGQFRPHGMPVLDMLVSWVCGGTKSMTTPPLIEALSPTEPLEEQARDYLGDRLIEGGSADARRRKAALAWMSTLHETVELDWETKPTLLDADHWKDMHAGGLFFTVRDAAFDVLNAVETHLQVRQDQRLSLAASLETSIVEKVAKLQAQAQNFLDLQHDPTPDQQARLFCTECCQENRATLLSALVKRDGRVLKLVDNAVVPIAGVAFRAPPAIEEDSENLGDLLDSTGSGGAELPTLPQGISQRVYNLYLLYQDLQGALDPYLVAPSNAETLV